MTNLLMHQLALPALVVALIVVARVVLRSGSARPGKGLSVSREWLIEHEVGRDGSR